MSMCNKPGRGEANVLGLKVSWLSAAGMTVRRHLSANQLEDDWWRLEVPGCDRAMGWLGRCGRTVLNIDLGWYWWLSASMFACELSDLRHGLCKVCGECVADTTDQKHSEFAWQWQSWITCQHHRAELRGCRRCTSGIQLTERWMFGSHSWTGKLDSSTDVGVTPTILVNGQNQVDKWVILQMVVPNYFLESGLPLCG